MAGQEGIVEHPGIVTGVDRNRIEVKILQVSACSSCRAKGMCGVAEMEEKVVDAAPVKGHEHKTGEKVTLVMKRTSGNRAVFLGYYLPFLIVVITLFGMISLTKNEGLSALVAIGMLIPYYTGLFMLKEKITKKMEIWIKPKPMDQQADNQ